MIHQDIWTILVGLLEDSPRALARTARVCRAANYAVTSRLPEIISGRARVMICPVTLRSPNFSTGVFSDDVHRIIGYNRDKLCEFTWGNIELTLMRSEDIVSIGLSIDDRIIARTKIDLVFGYIQNMHQCSNDDIAESLARFAVWLFPGIYGDVVLEVIPSMLGHCWQRAYSILLSPHEYI